MVRTFHICGTCRGTLGRVILAFLFGHIFCRCVRAFVCPSVLGSLSKKLETIDLSNEKMFKYLLATCGIFRFYFIAVLDKYILRANIFLEMWRNTSNILFAHTHRHPQFKFKKKTHKKKIRSRWAFNYVFIICKRLFLNGYTVFVLLLKSFCRSGGRLGYSVCSNKNTCNTLECRTGQFGARLQSKFATRHAVAQGTNYLNFVYS